MKNIWDEGVSDTISSGTVKPFHNPKFSFEHILHTNPVWNGVKSSFTSFERDSK